MPRAHRHRSKLAFASLPVGGSAALVVGFPIMSDTDVAEILKLPAAERLRLMELLWESLSANPSAVPLDDAHRAVIDERLAEHARDPDDIVTRDQVLARARRV